MPNVTAALPMPFIPITTGEAEQVRIIRSTFPDFKHNRPNPALPSVVSLTSGITPSCPAF